MAKQRLALLNFYFLYHKPDKEETKKYFLENNIDIDLIEQKKAKLLKKVKAEQKIIQGEKFAQKIKDLYQQIRNKEISITELGLSQNSTNDLVLQYNKFEGSEEELFKDMLREQTRLEIIEKIKNGEL